MAFEAPRRESPENLKTSEDRIVEHLRKLPPELRERWTDRFDETDEKHLPTFEGELRTFIEKRKEALNTSPRLFSDTRHLVDGREAVSQTLKVIHEAEKRPDLFVGEGTVASVHRSPRNPGLCYKVVHDLTEYASWNSVDKEGHFLEELEELSVEGVRVPHVSGIIDLPTIKVIEMEYLEAVSVEDALKYNGSILSNLDIDTFFKRLRSYVEVMHNKYNIYHRDLHGGNVLIGKDGTPYIIDFGCATRAFNTDEAYSELDKFRQKMERFHSDEISLYIVESELRAHVQKKV